MRRTAVLTAIASGLLAVAALAGQARAQSVSMRVNPDSADWASFKAEYAAARLAPRPVFERYLPRFGAGALLGFLEETYPACHPESHDLGRAIFAASRDLETALSDCGTGCTSGCMHGAVSEAFGTSSLEAVAGAMNQFCASATMRRLHKPGNCAHGLGHALMFLTNGDTRRSVDACLGFSLDPMKYYCATGVYMEKILTPKALEGLSAASLHAPCAVETLFPAACYRYNTGRLLYWFGDRTRVALECMRLDGPQRRGCFHGLGSLGGEVFREPSVMATICVRGDRDDKVACIEGLIEKLSDLDQARALAACGFVTAELRPVCSDAAERQMYSLDKPTFALYYDAGALHARAEPATARPPSHNH